MRRSTLLLSPCYPTEWWHDVRYGGRIQPRGQNGMWPKFRAECSRIQTEGVEWSGNTPNGCTRASTLEFHIFVQVSFQLINCFVSKLRTNRIVIIPSCCISSSDLSRDSSLCDADPSIFLSSMNLDPESESLLPFTLARQISNNPIDRSISKDGWLIIVNLSRRLWVWAPIHNIPKTETPSTEVLWVLEELLIMKWTTARRINDALRAQITYFKSM